MHGDFFPVNIVHFHNKKPPFRCKKRSQISQINKAFQVFYSDGGWRLCSSFLYTTSHDWKKHRQSHLGKEKKRPSSIYLVAKQLPSRVFALKMDKFVLKVKPKKKP